MNSDAAADARASWNLQGELAVIAQRLETILSRYGMAAHPASFSLRHTPREKGRPAILEALVLDERGQREEARARAQRVDERDRAQLVAVGWALQGFGP